MRTIAAIILAMLVILVAVPALAATAIDGIPTGIMAKLIPHASVIFKQGPGIQGDSAEMDCKSIATDAFVIESTIYTATRKMIDSAFSGAAPAFAAVSYQGNGQRHNWRMH